MHEIAITKEEEDTLGALLNRVEGGADVLLTRQGRPVARLFPVVPLATRERAAAAIERIRKQAAEAKIPFDWEELKRDRDEGRP